MKIAVLIKQVPDSDDVRMDPVVLGFAEKMRPDAEVAALQPGGIVMLENTRFYKAEDGKVKPAEGMSEEDKKLKADLEKKIKDQEAELDVLHARLSVRTQWDKVNEQIKAVKNDRKVWQEQLDEL